jgi:hypothetical protein
MLEMFAMFDNVQPHLQPHCRGRLSVLKRPPRRHIGGWRRVGFEPSFFNKINILGGANGTSNL